MNCKPTGTTNLYRDIDTGIYYARTSGVWRTLDTDAKTTALERLPVKLIEIRQQKEQGYKVDRTQTVGDCLDKFIESRTELRRIGKLTENGLRNIVARHETIKEVWGQKLLSMPVVKVEASDLIKKHNDLHTKYGATVVNGIKAVLFGAFQIAVDNKTLIHNPASQMHFKTPTPQVKEVPQDEDLMKLLNHLTERCDLPGTKTRWLQRSVDLIKFLCAFGCRKDEAAHVLKSHVNLKDCTVHFAKTKNGKPRTVPFDTATRPLIESLLAVDSNRTLDYTDRTGVHHAGEALHGLTDIHKTLASACEKIKIARLTHHTFRHYFATRALIATNCDYFAVSHWLGHSDGGKLLAKTYAHLHPSHSAQQIGKVKHAFSAAPAIAPAQTVTVNGIAYTLEQLAAMLPGKQEADNVIQLRKVA